MHRLALAMLIVGMSRAAAQLPCASDVLTSLPDGDVAWCAAATAPRLTTVPMVRYPDMLRSANVAGEAVLEATIDTSGRVDMRTLKVRAQTHVLFTNAVRQSMSQWRFVPARNAGAAVRARGVIHVGFVLPVDKNIPRESFTELPRETPAGLELAFGWRVLPFDPPATVDTVRMFALIATIARSHEKVDASRALCLEWSQSATQREPSAALLDYLRDHGAPRLPPSQCPPTYASMIQQLDSLGRPIDHSRGAVDPQILWIGELKPWTKDLFVFRYAVSVGTGGEMARCQAEWDARAAKWEVSCIDRRYYVF